MSHCRSRGLVLLRETVLAREPAFYLYAMEGGWWWGVVIFLSDGRITWCGGSVGFAKALAWSARGGVVVRRNVVSRHGFPQRVPVPIFVRGRPLPISLEHQYPGGIVRNYHPAVATTRMVGARSR